MRQAEFEQSSAHVQAEQLGAGSCGNISMPWPCAELGIAGHGSSGEGQEAGGFRVQLRIKKCSIVFRILEKISLGSLMVALWYVLL